MTKKPTYEELEKKIQGLEQSKYDHGQVEEKLRESEERFRTVIEQSPSAIEIYDPNGKLLIVNDAWEPFWDMQKSDMVNFNIFNDPECERTGLTSAFKKVLKDVECSIPPSKYDPKESGFQEGSIRWINSKMYPIKDQHGKIKNIVLVMEDITAQKYAEDALQKVHNELELKIKKRTKELHNELQERKQTEKTLLLNQKQLNEIHKIGTLVNSTLSLEVILQDILKNTLETVNASVGMIFLKDPVTGCLSWGASLGLSQDFVTAYENQDIQPGEGLTGCIAQTGEPIFLPVDSSHDPRIARSVITEEKFNSFIGVPIYASDEIVGVMNILTHLPDILSEHDVSICSTIGSLVGSSIRNAQLFANLEQTKKALQISEERLDLAIKGAGIGLWDWNVQTGEIIFNERWAKIVGYTLEELSPVSIKTWIDLCHPDDLDKSNKLLEKHFTGNNDYYLCEARMKHKNGHWVWVLDRGKVFEWSKDGKPLRATGTHIDITELKNSEKKLKESEEKYHTLAEECPISIMSFDHKGVVTFVNRWHLKTFAKLKHKPEFFIGKKITELPGLVRTEVIPELEKVLQGHSVVLQDVYFPEFAGGHSGYQNIKAVSTYKKGKVVGGILIREDATERKLAEDALREKESQLRQIIDLVPHFIFAKDETGKFEIVNKATAEVFGTTVEDLTGRRDSEFVATEEEMEHFRSDDLEVIKSGKTKFIPEEPITDSENNLRYLQTTKVPFKFSAIKKPSLLGIAVDITERKRVEEALRIEMDNLNNILESMTDGVYIVNQQYDIQYVNPVLTKDFGTYTGRKCYEYLHNKKEACPWCKNSDILTGKTIRWEWYSSKNKRTYDLIDTPLKNSDGSISKLEIFRDITKQKQAEVALRESEKKYRSMLEAMKDYAYICSHDFCIEYLNPRMISRIGRDAVGETCHKAIYDNEKRCSWCIFDKIQQGEHVEYELADPKDNHYYSITNSPILHSNGLISKLTIFRDITESKAIESQLRQARKMESVGTMAGGIAHDFNNLLYMITGNVELALEDIPEWNPTHANLEAIKTAGLRAAGIVKQLLNFSRKTDQELRPIGAITVIKDALKFLRSTIPTTIEIRKHLPDTDVTILADPIQINQLLMNLCTNYCGLTLTDTLLRAI